MKLLDKKWKWAVAVILLLGVALLLYGLYTYFFWTCCAPPPKSEPATVNGTDSSSIINAPDLLYAKRTWSGLCANQEGETGGCSSRTYLYLSGKLVMESDWTDGTKKIINPTTQKELDRNFVVQIIKQIRDFGILDKACKAGLVFDYGANYFINLDGAQKEIEFPGCESELNEIDKLIDSAADK